VRHALVVGFSAGYALNGSAFHTVAEGEQGQA
jgi:hypothetical protein